MASTKLTNFAICSLGIATFATCFLIILHNSFMNAHESSGKRTNFVASVPYEEDEFGQKVNKNVAYVGDNKRMRGRKMLQRKDKLKKRSAEAKLDGSNHESNISGSFATTKKPFQWISPATFEVSTNSKVGKQDSKKINDDGSEEISEAADEVVNMMMRKDYKGSDRPRHKGPINNHNPTYGP